MGGRVIEVIWRVSHYKMTLNINEPCKAYQHFHFYLTPCPATFKLYIYPATITWLINSALMTSVKFYSICSGFLSIYSEFDERNPGFHSIYLECQSFFTYIWVSIQFNPNPNPNPEFYSIYSNIYFLNRKKSVFCY